MPEQAEWIRQGTVDIGDVDDAIAGEAAARDAAIGNYDLALVADDKQVDGEWLFKDKARFRHIAAGPKRGGELTIFGKEAGQELRIGQYAFGWRIEFVPTTLAGPEPEAIAEFYVPVIFSISPQNNTIHPQLGLRNKLDTADLSLQCDTDAGWGYVRVGNMEGSDTGPSPDFSLGLKFVVNEPTAPDGVQHEALTIHPSGTLETPFELDVGDQTGATPGGYFAPGQVAVWTSDPSFGIFQGGTLAGDHFLVEASGRIATDNELDVGDQTGATPGGYVASGQIGLWTNDAGNGLLQLSLTGDADNRFLVENGGARIRLGGGAVAPDVRLERRAAGILSLGDAIELDELGADAAAPAANRARLYSRDNGAGKTQVVARFNSGAVQVIATEP